jgi:hypothetical protein
MRNAATWLLVASDTYANLPDGSTAIPCAIPCIGNDLEGVGVSTPVLGSIEYAETSSSPPFAQYKYVSAAIVACDENAAMKHITRARRDKLRRRERI